MDRDILDIIPERFDADEDSSEARAGSRIRMAIMIIVALIAIGGIVLAGWKFLGARKMMVAGVPVIKADDKPVKIRPEDRGGMDVPNQDKLVYGKMEGATDEGAPKTEKLLAPPEEPKMPVVKDVAPEPPAMPPMKPEESPVKPAMAPEPSKPPPATKKVAANTAPAQTATPAESAAPTPAAAAPATGGNYLVQLGAVRSADAAPKEWSRIQKANTDLLAGLTSDIVQVDIPDKGTFWRIRAGTMTESAAKQLCQQLAGRNQGCLVVRK